MIMNKLYNALVELEEKGTLQEQALRLFDEERTYKGLIMELKKQIRNENFEESEELILAKNKCEVRLDNIKNEMAKLNTRIIKTLETIEPVVSVATLMEKFGLEDITEYDFDEDFYGNLLSSSTKIGHVCRQGLIRNEEIVKEMETMS